MKRMIAFDLDGTLAESKQPIAPEMAELLGGLLDVALVDVISGGDWPQFLKQVVERLPKGAKLGRLFIQPTTGAKLFRFKDGAWGPIYEETFTPEERDQALKAIEEAVAKLDLNPEKTWGEQLEDRGAQITFSGLGQEAPLDAKTAWDPDRRRREALQKAVAEKLPDLSVKIGGSTSIDITRQGVDKAYGMKRLCEESGVSPAEILFMGDAIFPGGNDDPVRAAGIDVVKVRDPADTRTAITAVIACLKGVGAAA